MMLMLTCKDAAVLTVQRGARQVAISVTVRYYIGAMALQDVPRTNDGALSKTELVCPVSQPTCRTSVHCPKSKATS